MKWTKLLIGLLILIGISSQAQAQWDKIYFGMYCYDFDNPNFVQQNRFPFGTDPNEGNDIAYLKGISDYNFNLVLPVRQLIQPTPSCVDIATGQGPSKTFLDNAHCLGLKVLLNIPEKDQGKNGNPPPCPGTIQDRINAAVTYFNDHPSIIGYGVSDEIPYSSIGNTAWRSQLIRASDATGTKARFTNLMGMWADWDRATDQSPICDYVTNPCSKVCVEDYDAYLDAFIDDVDPEIMTYTSFYLADRPGTCFPNTFSLPEAGRHFLTMDRMARKSVEHGVPWALANQTITQPWIAGDGECFSCSKSGAPNFIFPISEESYFRFKLHTSFAYGAKGMMYWTRESSYGGVNLGYNYWDNELATQQAPNVPITNNQAIGLGAKNVIRDLHGELLANNNLLMNLEFQDAYHVKDLSTHPQRIALGYKDDILPDSYWNNFYTNPTTVQYFDIGVGPNFNNPFDATVGNTNDFLMVSFLKDASITTQNDYFWVVNKHLSDDTEVEIHFKSNYQIWEVLGNKMCTNTDAFTVHLEPGEGKLFGIRTLPLTFGQTLCGRDWNPNPGPTQQYPEILYDQLQFGANTYPNSCADNFIRNGAEITFRAGDIFIDDEMTVEAGAEVLFASATFDCGTFKMGDSPEVEEELYEFSKLSFKVYPNPSSGRFEVEANAADASFRMQVYDTFGRLIQQPDQAFEGKASLNLSGQSAGIYFIRIESGGLQTVEKVMIQ